MSDKPENPRAYPCDITEIYQNIGRDNQTLKQYQPGMTLLDKFASDAAIRHGFQDGNFNAKLYYQQASAMLKERQKWIKNYE